MTTQGYHYRLTPFGELSWLAIHNPEGDELLVGCGWVDERDAYHERMRAEAQLIVDALNAHTGDAQQTLPHAATAIPDADPAAAPLDLIGLLREVEAELARLTRPTRRVRLLRHRVFWAIAESDPLPE